MKKTILIAILSITSFATFSQSSNFASGGSCTVPAGWTSCSSNCWFSDCCIVWNPNVSEGGCGCWFGVALCKTAPIGVSTLISNTSSTEATVKFSFDRFQEFIAFLNTNGISTGSISSSLNTFQKNYVATSGKASVQTTDYISFQSNYVSFINKLSTEQKNLIISFINDKQKNEVVK